MTTHKILIDAEERMKKTLEGTRRELSGIRTGKATPALLDTVRVEAYGQMVSLKEVGQVSAPEARLLVVQPWDKSLIKAVTRAIQQSELGLNPTDDGTVVRVPIPTLTEDRRRDLVKLLAKLTEEGRVHVRQVRHDVNKDIKHQQDGGTLAEDDAKRLTGDVQKLTDRYIALIDELLKKKTAEVMEV
jgi:ribosome recycling factor